MKIQNTAALITGASRGLGRALALALGRAGARLVLVAREAAPLDAVVSEVRQAGGVAHGITADIGDKLAIHRIAGEAAALVGPIDLLIHNASTLGPTPLPLLLDTECEDFERVLQVNLLGPFRLSKIVAGSMALRGGGLVVSISSDAAVEAYPRWGAYSVSKAALDHLSRIWAAELVHPRPACGWVAARIIGKDVFAHTSPVKLGEPRRGEPDLAPLRIAVEKTREWVESVGRFHLPKRKEQHLARIADALAKLGAAP